MSLRHAVTIGRTTTTDASLSSSHRLTEPREADRPLRPNASTPARNAPSRDR
ncbi:MAG: hypothetical protein ACF8SC_07285 [Phycisphaerales bacterium JB037]